MIDVGTLRSWLGTDPSQDTVLELLEERVVGIVQGRTGRYFGPVAELTEHIVGDGGMKLRLAEIPVDIPATLEERIYPGADPTTITATADDGYLLRTLTDPAPNLAWLVRKNGGIWSRGCEYTVTYDRGYATGAEPARARQLVIGIAQYLWGIRRAQGGAMQSETFDKYVYRLAENAGAGSMGLPDWATDEIAFWQRVAW